MSGILIYTEEEAKRNAFAVEKFKEYLGVRLETPDYRGEADFVINRTNRADIGEFFEKRGIRVFNPSAFSALANDKEKCYRFMEENSIEILPTNWKTPPFVVKPRDGHGGKGVRLIKDGDPIPQDDPDLVFQKAADDLGKDLRVWVVGKEIVTSILRVSKTDFRSNYCLGGDAVPYHLSEDEEKEVRRIISLVNGDYYGVDFLFNNGKLIFNELEDTVGARMVYDKTDIDILKLYCNYINNMVS